MPYRIDTQLFFIDTETTEVTEVTEVTELWFIPLNRFTNLDVIEVYQQPCCCSSRVNFKHTL